MNLKIERSFIATSYDVDITITLEDGVGPPVQMPINIKINYEEEELTSASSLQNVGLEDIANSAAMTGEESKDL
jgi:hypothetical protein